MLVSSPSRPLGNAEGGRQRQERPTTALRAGNEVPHATAGGHTVGSALK